MLFFFKECQSVINHWFTYFCHLSVDFRGLLSHRRCSRPGVGCPLPGWRRLQSAIVPTSVATGRETVPTVSPAWASTHQDTSTVPFQTTTTAAGTSGLGKSWTGLGSGLLCLKTTREVGSFASFHYIFESGKSWAKRKLILLMEF